VIYDIVVLFVTANVLCLCVFYFFFQAEDGIRDRNVTGVQTCALPISTAGQIAGAILAGIFHPDWSYVYNGSGEDLISQLWETICIAFLGTFISAVIS